MCLWEESIGRPERECGKGHEAGEVEEVLPGFIRGHELVDFNG